MCQAADPRIPWKSTILDISIQKAPKRLDEHYHNSLQMDRFGLCLQRVVVETLSLDYKKIERKDSKSSKEEAGPKDDTDRGEGEGENSGGCENKEAANRNVANLSA